MLICGRPHSESRLTAAARRRGASTVVAALAAAAVVVGPVVGDAPAAALAVVHVSPDGDDAATGSSSAPVRTVTRAVAIAPPGAAVELASGVYHESVQVYSKQLHLRAASGASVVFDGARPVTGWEPTGSRWQAPWSTDLPRSGRPLTTLERPEAGWPEQFFVDGEPLDEVTSRGAVDASSFFVDRSAGVVVIGVDPAGRLVEGSDLAWAVYLNAAHGSSLRDVVVRRYATPSVNMAAVRAYADDLVIADVAVEDNAHIGLSMMGDRITATRVTARRNGHLGLHAHRAASLRIEGATVAGNNAAGFDPRHSAGGLKVTTSVGVAVLASMVVDNAGPGIWTDIDATELTIVGNDVRRNLRSGIQVELSTDARVVDNVVTDNGEAGLWVLESRRVWAWHNALFGNLRDVWVEDGPRGDVTEVELVNNVLGGDGRGAAPAILNVDDWIEERSAVEMGVVADHNHYWRPPTSTVLVSRWARWPDSLALSGTLVDHRAATRQDPNATLVVAVTNPYAVDGDARAANDAPAGVALPADIAALVGHETGDVLRAGPLETVSSRPPSTEPPSTGPPPERRRTGVDAPAGGTSAAVRLGAARLDAVGSMAVAGAEPTASAPARRVPTASVTTPVATVGWAALVTAAEVSRG